MKILTYGAFGLALLSPQLAAAQESAADEPIDAGEIRLENWDYEAIYTGGGWSVDSFFGTDVYGEGGEQLGDVEDLVLDAGGKVVALIAEVGGFWDIGDTHVGIPWEEVDIQSSDRVSIPLTEETVDSYDIFEYSGLGQLGEEVVTGLDDEPLGQGFWRASDLLGDYVRVRDENDERYLNFGYVSDILIQDDEIAATVIRAGATYGRGSYAYPRGPGFPANWTPAAPAYDLPYLEGDVRSLPEFDYERMQSDG